MIQLLLSSDGIFDVLDLNDLSKILNSCKTARDGCRRILSRALAAGATDNLTAIVVEMN